METSQKKSIIVILFPVLFFVLQLASVIITTTAVGLDLSWIIQSALMMIMSFALCYSYYKHIKNVMKPLLGATLILLFTYEVDLACYYLVNIEAVFRIYPTRTSLAIFATVTMLGLLVVVALNVLHYLINADHKASPKLVKANKVLYYVFIVCIIVKCVCLAILDNNTMSIIGNLLGCVADVFALGLVVYIEHSMDEFRLDRQAAGWTKEEGYPEGYNH